MSNFPTEHMDSVREAAALHLWPRVEAWLKEGGDPDADDAKDQFIAVMVRSFETDGFKLAKEFDDEGWEADASLVDILDHFNMDLHHACKAAREQWVKDTGWTPAFKVGDVVQFKLSLKWEAGIITDVKEGEGIYTIAKGNTAKPKTGGYIIANGDVKAAA